MPAKIEVILIKNTGATITSPIEASKMLNINPETIRRWHRSGKRKVFCNGYDVYLNVEEK